MKKKKTSFFYMIFFPTIFPIKRYLLLLNVQEQENVMNKLNELNMIMNKKKYIIYLISYVIYNFSLVSFIILSAWDLKLHMDLYQFFVNHADNYKSTFYAIPEEMFYFNKIQVFLLVVLSLSFFVKKICEKNKKRR